VSQKYPRSNAEKWLDSSFLRYDKIRDDKINVEYNGSSYDFSKEEFNRKPRAVMQKIFNIEI